LIRTARPLYADEDLGLDLDFDSNSDLYTILQILSLTLLENTLLALLVTRMESISDAAYTHNQRNLFISPDSSDRSPFFGTYIR